MRRSVLLLGLALVAGLAAPAFAQPGQSFDRGPPGFDRDRDRDRDRGRDSLRILSAWYGVESRACEATRAVARACNGRRDCTVQATNRLCGDPVPQVVKVLTVTYRCDGRIRSITRGEGRYLGLTCNARGRR
jgi:hypothetical protein